MRLRRQAQREMSRWAAQIRDIEGMRGLSEWLQVRLNGFFAEKWGPVAAGTAGAAAQQGYSVDTVRSAICDDYLC